ncbi:immunomodulatory protein [Laetiporus sulphureus 93-53]|uniref:Immunomodulatory protein n=1 Tax=Laetiporus sulphureus 93-53 TaxID=1314785 RepID=A0A165CCU6_9APHY|nr:immunomodulatory protein [Laetiporus sulphureus 93-53]KZT02580.1 immunomodulatory protein [Laetiporus sulphureus 93-53]
MKFTVALVAAVCAVPAVLAGQYKVTYDTIYDNANDSVDNVACSGTLSGKGYTTFGSLPDFPYIGGAFAVTGYDSPGCGTCWELTYNGTSINIFAIDTAAEGFNIAEEALNALTHGNAVQDGYVYAAATQVDVSACGGY